MRALLLLFLLAGCSFEHSQRLQERHDEIVYEDAHIERRTIRGASSDSQVATAFRAQVNFADFLNWWTAGGATILAGASTWLGHRLGKRQRRV